MSAFEEIWLIPWHFVLGLVSTQMIASPHKYDTEMFGASHVHFHLEQPHGMTWKRVNTDFHLQTIRAIHATVQSKEDTERLVIEFASAITIPCPEKESWVARKGKESIYNAFQQIIPQVCAYQTKQCAHVVDDLTCLKQ